LVFPSYTVINHTVINQDQLDPDSILLIYMINIHEMVELDWTSLQATHQESCGRADSN